MLLCLYKKDIGNGNTETTFDIAYNINDKKVFEATSVLNLDTGEIINDPKVEPGYKVKSHILEVYRSQYGYYENKRNNFDDDLFEV